jgi:phage terminase large subunit-like protein
MTAAEATGDVSMLADLALDDCRAELALPSDAHRRDLQTRWRHFAHPGQLPPTGRLTNRLIMAGRGFGKTRAGAEWVHSIAENDSTARIALVAASLGEARTVMVEGESGLLSVSDPRFRPRFEPSRRLLTWPGGVQTMFYSSGELDSQHGRQHSHAWCDEIAKWDNAAAR